MRVRTGIVLDPRGGALRQMLPPFRLGAGARLGDGRQWMPWIHLADLASMFQFVVETPVRGPFNGVAPYPVTNAEFTQRIGECAAHRPALLALPPFALKLLYGEMAEVLLGESAGGALRRGSRRLPLPLSAIGRSTGERAGRPIEPAV